MAWTTPKTWADGDIVTAVLLNTHIKDNQEFLSVHTHSGAAGQGNDELAGIDSIAFDDQSASPNAAGELQRNGANLEWYGSAVVAITQGDAAAGVASPRTIGTGALTAAPGNHAAIHNAGGSNALAIDAAAGTGSLRTLGTGATTGAPGNHGHTLSSPTQETVNPASGKLDTTTLHLDYYNPAGFASEVVGNGTTENLFDFEDAYKVSAVSFWISCLTAGTGGNVKVYWEADGTEISSTTRSASAAAAGGYLLLAVAMKNTADIAWLLRVENNATGGTVQVCSKPTNAFITTSATQVSQDSGTATQQTIGGGLGAT